MKKSVSWRCAISRPAFVQRARAQASFSRPGGLGLVLCFPEGAETVGGDPQSAIRECVNTAWCRFRGGGASRHDLVLRSGEEGKRKREAIVLQGKRRERAEKRSHLTTSRRANLLATESEVAPCCKGTAHLCQQVRSHQGNMDGGSEVMDVLTGL